jgi:hypothetical protein
VQRRLGKLRQQGRVIATVHLFLLQERFKARGPSTTAVEQEGDEGDLIQLQREPPRTTSSPWGPSVSMAAAGSWVGGGEGGGGWIWPEEWEEVGSCSHVRLGAWWMAAAGGHPGGRCSTGGWRRHDSVRVGAARLVDGDRVGAA